MTSETALTTGDPEQELPATSPAVRASVTIPAPPSRVWEHLTSVSGTEALLGAGARLATKGEPWHSSDGTHGVLRSYHPLEQIRVSWHPHEDGPRSMVDVQLSPEGDGTRIDLAQDGEGSADASRWQGALSRFASTLDS